MPYNNPEVRGLGMHYLLQFDSFERKASVFAESLTYTTKTLIMFYILSLLYTTQQDLTM